MEYNQQVHLKFQGIVYIEVCKGKSKHNVESYFTWNWDFYFYIDHYRYHI